MEIVWVFVNDHVNYRWVYPRKCHSDGKEISFIWCLGKLFLDSIGGLPFRFSISFWKCFCGRSNENVNSDPHLPVSYFFCVRYLKSLILNVSRKP